MSWSSIIDTRLDVLLREIDAAFVERDLGSYYYGVSTGTNIQSAALFTRDGGRQPLNHGYQRRIEAAVTGVFNNALHSYLRFVNNSAILNPTQTDFDCWTLETFAAAAGLQYPDLWRRKTTMDGDFLYGRMQAGDILGPWVIEDLQKALSALTRWVRRGRYNIEHVGCSVWPFGKDERKWSDYDGDLSQAKSRTLDAWNAASWEGKTPMEATASVHQWSNYYWAELILNTVCAAVNPDAYPDGTVYRVYIQGDAVAEGIFNGFGYAFVVEGVNPDVIRLAKTITFPSGEITDLGFSEYGATYGFPVLMTTSPPWPAGTPVWPDAMAHGFSIPMAWDGDNETAYLRQYYYLVEPALTYG